MTRPRIRSAMSDYEAKRLGFWARDRRVTEFGSLLGFSTVVIAKVARHVVSVDRHNGYPCLPNNTERAFRCNLDRYNVAHKVSVAVGEIIRARDYPTPDLAFIDLDGTYQTTLVAARLIPAPLVVIHDYGRHACHGVARTVEWLRFQHAWHVLERADTLIVMERR